MPSVAQPDPAVPASDAAGPGSDESADAPVRWPWLAGAAAALALLGAGLLLWRRRRSVVVPEIEIVGRLNTLKALAEFIAS